MANDHQFDNEGHIILSHNLLTLLQWLIDHEAETFRKLIIKAIENGFRSHTQAQTDDALELHIDDDSSQQSVIEFLGLLNTLLIEETNQKATERFLDRTRLPVIDHIDATICDNKTLQTSIEKAHSKLEHNPRANLEQLLLREILKQWKPDKKKHLVNN